MRTSLLPLHLAFLLAMNSNLSADGDASPVKTEPPVASSPTGAATTRGPKIDGEQFCVRQIVDSQQGGLPVSVFMAPERWRDRSQVVWNYEHTSNPVTAWAVVENPANEEAFFLHPGVLYFCLRPDAGYFRPGQNSGGLIYTTQPLPPAQALATVVRQLRATSPSLEFVGQKDLPELAKSLQIAGSAKQRGVGLKVTYRFNGQPVEEEFYAVFDAIDIPYDGPQGRTWQINWGLTAVHSFRAPAGTLERRRPVFSAIANARNDDLARLAASASSLAFASAISVRLRSEMSCKVPMT